MCQCSLCIVLASEKHTRDSDKGVGSLLGEMDNDAVCNSTGIVMCQGMYLSIKR